MATGFEEYCDQLWQDWINDNLQVDLKLASRFQMDHMPEPYLLFGDGERHLCVLTTNPGIGMEHQTRQAIRANRSCVEPLDNYHDAAVKLAQFYSGHLRGQAKTRIDKLVSLAEQIGNTGVLQFESCPYHSAKLPEKRSLPDRFEQDSVMQDYTHLLENRLRNETCVALSAVGSNKPISQKTITENVWLSWQAGVMAFEPDTADIIPLSRKGDKVTSAFIYSRMNGLVKGFILMMGGNHLPGQDHLSDIARVLRGGHDV